MANTVEIIPVVLTISGLLHKESRRRLQRAGVELDWTKITRDLVIQNAKDVSSFIKNHPDIIDQSSQVMIESDQDSQCESVEITQSSGPQHNLRYEAT